MIIMNKYSKYSISIDAAGIDRRSFFYSACRLRSDMNKLASCGSIPHPWPVAGGLLKPIVTQLFVCL